MTHEDRKKLHESLLEAADTRAIESLSVKQLAEAAGVNVEEALGAFASPLEIADDYFANFKNETLQTYQATGEESVRDRLFELTMMIFDTFGTHKPAIKSIERYLLRNPSLLKARHNDIQEMFRTLLALAGVRVKGLRGNIRLQVFMVIFARVYHVWKQDETIDMAKTMAELDKRLNQAEKWENQSLCTVVQGCFKRDKTYG